MGRLVRVVAAHMMVGPPDAVGHRSAKPAVHHDTAKRPSRTWSHRLQVLGLLLVVTLCLLRNASLVILTVSPNATTNHLMSTTEYDDGNLWRILDPDATIVGVGVASLGLVCVAYAFIPLLFTTRRRILGPWNLRLQSFGERFASAHPIATKFVDLAIQCAFLVQQLETGMPVPIVLLFAGVLSLNASVTSLFLWLPHRNLGNAHVFVDTAFDFVVAVAYPLCVVIYCTSIFTLDRELVAINLNGYHLGAFEHTVAIYVNPVELALIRHSLDALRISTVLDIFTRVGVSLVLCWRCYTLGDFIVAAYPSRLNVYPRNRLASLGFVVLAIAVILYTGMSIRASANACAPHRECVQAAHRWVLARAADSTSACPCIALVDRELRVATFEEWKNPRDDTFIVDQLALSGDLQTIQLVNRALPTLPPNVRRCTNLRVLSLIYTNTKLLPDWTRELTRLEYLHIEGKMDDKSLHSLPSDMFVNMPRLTFLQIAQHPIEHLPSFNGLHGLKVLNLVLLLEVDELPSFEHLVRLEHLTFGALPRVETIPDLSHTKNFKSLGGFERGAYCCNGFLDGNCDLTDWKCREHPIWGTPPVTTCLPPDRRATPATLSIVRQFPHICTAPPLPKNFSFVPVEYLVRQCNGTMYRQCSVPGAETRGICINARWMAIFCDVDAEVETLRRVQIAHGVGQPCDPDVEAWLGCPATVSRVRA